MITSHQIGDCRPVLNLDLPQRAWALRAHLSIDVSKLELGPLENRPNPTPLGHDRSHKYIIIYN